MYYLSNDTYCGSNPIIRHYFTKISKAQVHVQYAVLVSEILLEIMKFKNSQLCTQLSFVWLNNYEIVMSRKYFVCVKYHFVALWTLPPAAWRPHQSSRPPSPHPTLKTLEI